LHSLDFWRPAERNAFLVHDGEHAVVEPVKMKNPSNQTAPPIVNPVPER
jgi:hypothetical protein